MTNAMTTGTPVRQTDPDAVGLGAFAADATAQCPYLAPSLRARQTWWTHLPAPAAPEEGEQLAAGLFAAGLRAGEWVRQRVADGDRLACEVVSVDWPVSLARRQAVLAWPHWALKLLFAPVGVLVGKFAPDHPGADCVVLAVRASVPARDRRLLTRTPGLAHTVASAVDDGRRVLAAVPGVPFSTDSDLLAAWPAVRAWAATLADFPHHSDIEATDAAVPARRAAHAAGPKSRAVDSAGGLAVVLCAS